MPVVCKKHSAACTVCWRRDIVWGVLEALSDGISTKIVASTTITDVWNEVWKRLHGDVLSIPG